MAEKGRPVHDTRVWVGACTLCEGCILAAGHRGKHKVADMKEEEYEVELIISERRGRTDGAHRATRAPHAPGRCETETDPLAHSAGSEYLVKWKGWPQDDATWEAAPTLANCPKVLQAWRASAAGATGLVLFSAVGAGAAVDQPPCGGAAAGARRDSTGAEACVDKRPAASTAAAPETSQGAKALETKSTCCPQKHTLAGSTAAAGLRCDMCRRGIESGEQIYSSEAG